MKQVIKMLVLWVVLTVVFSGCTRPKHECPSTAGMVPESRLRYAFTMGVECGVRAEEDLSESDGFFFMDHVHHKALEIYADILEQNGQEDRIIVGDRLKTLAPVRFHGKVKE